MHLTEYLFRRLHQINIRSIFGVPGDFNLTALDYIELSGLKWIGNVNELNAGISAIVTTFGVGELSAINALAGASAELVPVIHIVGLPSTTAKAKKLPLHHTLGDGYFDLFIEMSARIYSAVAILNDSSGAIRLIDETIIQCYQSSHPVYIGLPMDFVGVEVDASALETPLNLQRINSNPPDLEKEAVNAILERLDLAQNPVILVDSLAGKYDSLQSTRAFVKESELPCYIFPMAKGVIDESLSTFRGLYSGGASEVGVQQQIQSSDLILLIGSRSTGMNTGGFKDDLANLDVIRFQKDGIEMKNVNFPGLCMNGVLEKLSDRICSSRSDHASTLSSERSSSSGGENAPSIFELSDPGEHTPYEKSDVNTLLTQDWTWKRISSWLEEDDIIAMDVGTSLFGAVWTRHSRGTISLFQLLWSSIGFAVGAAVGAAVAERDQQETKISSPQRTILLTVIFIVCNEGYAVERAIHGTGQSYNDIQPWDFKLLPMVFQPEPGTVETYSVRTQGELETLLSNPLFGPASNFNEDKSAPLRLVEVHMGRDDIPQSMADCIRGMHGG
ncbi:hypothetical protein N7495_002218 [Penicillium taxi]|uniref:uncharacterized protein n=1 Tax=Penicillium taxi TaxID=168475 RepID=UPI0025458AF7|nr:uncharacterized protein N7495_002218 [Penicillium taxi]KAJ5901690.1 hypothetical protein N7495_002218 [Penicillium taxi]